MNFTFSRNLSLAVFAAVLLGGGLYLANRERHEALPQNPAAAGKEAVAATGAGRGPNGVDPGRQAAQTGPGRDAVVAAAKRPNVFGLSGVVELADVPVGRFRDELSRLSETARRHALGQLEELRVPRNDVASLSADRDGGLFYQCHPRLPPPPLASLAGHNEALAGSPGAPEIIEAAAEVPIAAPPLRHSRPGATKVIYLDFNGQSISGSAWNNEKGTPGDENYRPAVATYEAKPFNADGNPNSFSDAEQAVILRVWERVAEDYRGFDVDVTTEEPATFNANTGRILITDNVDANGVNMPSSTGSGVAYIGVFGRANYASYYSPALVYANQDYNYASYIAETASHEMGHNLSLSHDGTNSGDEYYDGHGTGETSWNTIMGGAFTENVTQWSKGEYYNANNTEDDLAIIAGHLGYVPDDHADSNGSATPLAVSGLAVSAAGVISQTGEADRFSFESGAGAITLSATTFRSASQSYGGNLDVALELYDTGGSLVASANVDGVTNATLNTTVAGGTYYLRVLGAASGTPLNNPPSGYTNYGSLGQYTISGTIVSTAPVAPSITSQPASVAVYTGQSVQFTVAASGYPAPSFQWRKGGVNIGGATGSTYFIASAATGDAGSYTCVATNTAGTTTSNAASLTVNPPSLPTFTSQPVGQTVPVGNAVTFSASASGVPAPTYQWRKNGAMIDGATGVSYTIVHSAFGDAGSYSVAATNLVGTVVSAEASLTVYGPPSITATSPARQVVTPGQILSLSVTAAGHGSLSYQWTHDGRVVPGANGSSYSVGNFASKDGGWYQVIVSDDAGSSRSAAFFVFGNPGAGRRREIVCWGVGQFEPPSVVDPVEIVYGYSHSLALRADGTVVGWGGNNLGQTTIPAGLTGVVAIAAGTAHSLAAKSDGTVVGWGRNDYGQTNIPAGLNNVVAVAAGDTHSLALKSDGTVVGWGYNGSGQLNIPANLSGVVAIRATFNITAALKSDGTAVRWDTTGGYGVPGDLTGMTEISVNSTHMLALKADGTVIDWTWNSYKPLPPGFVDVVSLAGNGLPYAIKNDGSVVLNTSSLSSADKSVFNNLSHVLSLTGGSGNWVALRETNIAPAPVIVAQPISQVVMAGESVTFSITANGTPTPTYQWQKGGVDVVGATGTSYTIASVSDAEVGRYRVIATNPSGVDVSNGADLAISNGPGSPVITTQPQSAAGLPGPSVSFTVAASSGTAPAYQWQLRSPGSVEWIDVPVSTFEVWTPSYPPVQYTYTYSGINAPTLQVLPALSLDGSQFRCIVSNSAGYVTSQPATLTVYSSPVVTTQPFSQTVSLGGTVSFVTAASGAPTPSLQWQKGGVNITGATGSSYTISSVGAGDVGSYTVVATNTYGSTTSNVATLTLGTIPAGFDVTAYLARYPEVAAVYGANPYAAWQHYHDVGIYQGEVFDELFRVDEYLALYPELFALFGSNLGAALDHWLSTGRIEGKLGRIPLEFSATGYFTRNPDVATAVNNNPILAWGHYWLYGIYEGRAYDDELRVFEYLAINADLTAAFVNDWRTAALHWMRYGRTEGRLGRLPLTFSVTTYLNRNPDVAAVWGTDPTTVFLHYWMYGINEARTYDDLFRVDDYLALNPDVAAIFGTDRRGAFKHWVRYGQSEGRPAKNP